MKKKLNLLYLLALIIFSIGCGDSGGDKAVGPVTPAWNNQYYPLATSLRTPSLGDNSSYTITGETTDSSSPADAIAGTTSSFLVSTKIKINDLDYSCYGEQSAMNFTVGGQSVVSNIITYYSYDAAANRLILLGDNQGFNNSVRLVLDRSKIPAIEYSVGYSKSYEIEYDNGQKAQISDSVVGKEEIATPIGRFETWKIVTTITTSTSDLQRTAWFSTTLRGIVKAELISSDSSGALIVTTKMTTLINTTNVPL